MDNCIFCKIMKGEIPSTTLFENDEIKVIFDVGPATRGHALVIPKAHFENVMEIPDELLAKAHVVAKKIAIALQEETGCAGVNILQNNGKIAGQSVFHLHIHVIPRYENDAAKIGWQPGEVDSEFLNELAKRIGEKLK